MLIAEYTVTWFTLLWPILVGPIAAVAVGVCAGWIRQGIAVSHRQLKAMPLIATVVLVGLEVGMPLTQ